MRGCGGIRVAGAMLLASLAPALAAVRQAAPPPAAAAPRLDQVLPVDPAVRIGRLPNGISYYIRKNGRPEKRVALRLAVQAGSVLEDEDQRGLAHFLEHMNFNGSEHFKPGELVAYLESIGARFGADAWSVETPDCRSIRRAVDWFVPYLTGAKPWAWRQAKPFDATATIPSLAACARRFPGEGYEDAIRKAGPLPPDHRYRLLYDVTD